MNRSQRLVVWASSSILGTAAGVALVVALTPSPLLGLVWATGVAAVGALAGGLGVNALIRPVLRGEAELIAKIDADAPLAMSGDLGGIAAAVSRRVDRQRAALERAERELRVARQVIDSSAVGLVVVEVEDGRITYANPAFRTMCRLRVDPVGRRPLEVAPAVEVHEAVARAIGGEPTRVGFATGWADMVVRAERLEGDIVVVRVEDVTGAKEAERSRSDFVANVSHELRTPITAIMGYTETLLGEAESLPDPTVAMLRTLERNARRLRDLFEDLLRLHRIETRLKQLPIERRRLQPVLERAMVDAAERAAMRGLDIELDVPDDLEGWCNPDALDAMVSNLARNAVSYTPDGGHVKVRAYAADGTAVIDVEDDGIGIHPVHHERIFERFYRVDEARSRRAGGTGLGLAIVKHYALATNSRVEVRSEHGKGSTFTSVLPARKR